MGKKRHKIFFALHLYRIPDCKPFLSSLNAAARLLKRHGYDPYKGMKFGDPYIQKARNDLVKQFLDSDCDTFFFVADDLEFEPEAVLQVLETPGEVVAGAYSMKCTPAEFGGILKKDDNGKPIVREDGCVAALGVQTGFLRIDRSVFEKIIEGYPELAFWGMDKDGNRSEVSHDFFPQGVHNHRWIGEDYAFCNLWTHLDGEIWIVPDIDFVHYDMEPSKEPKGYPGNFHEYLLKQPGGSNEREGKLERVFECRTAPLQSLKPLLDSLPLQDSTMVEIGVYTGEATEIFQQSGKFTTIHAVDPWVDGYNDSEVMSIRHNMDVVEELFDERVSGYNEVKKLKMTSMEAVKLFKDGSLDFVYVDGTHAYKAVKEDILSWMPKIKPAGILAGHDYGIYSGVNKAVDEIFGTSVEHFPDASWMVRR